VQPPPAAPADQASMILGAAARRPQPEMIRAGHDYGRR
jgi:hypothetical protein